MIQGPGMNRTQQRKHLSNLKKRTKSDNNPKGILDGIRSEPFQKKAVTRMAFTYEQRRRPQGQEEPVPEQTTAPGPDFNALMTGSARPSTAQKGRRIDLDGAMKAKMAHAFGDLSAVKFYESAAVGQAGAEAVAQGNEIAFAPGMTDFSSRTGQERLGHELSHVMSQRSGGVRGQGFLANSSLEARADREGAMAAAGEQIYSGPVTSALSPASPSPAVAGPMQAKRQTAEEKRASSQANRLFAIENAYNYPDEQVGYETKKLRTPQDESFYSFATSEPDLPLLRELSKRVDKYGQKMIQERNKMMRKNPGISQTRANYNVRLTNNGYDYKTYSGILNQMMQAYIGNSADVLADFNAERENDPVEIQQMRIDAQDISDSDLDTLQEDDFLKNGEYDRLQEEETAKDLLQNERRRMLYNKYHKG